MAKQQKSYYGGYCLGPCLRKLRLKAGYSQKNVADLLNVSRSTYTYYETGKTSPDPFTLNRPAAVAEESPGKRLAHRRSDFPRAGGHRVSAGQANLRPGAFRRAAPGLR